MISNSDLSLAKKFNQWIVVHLKDRIRNLDHVECLSDDFVKDDINKLVVGFCPCDNVKWCIPYHNINGIAIIPPNNSPHSNLLTIIASEYLILKTRFVDRDSLVSALEELYGKGNVEVYETPQHLRGYQNDMRPEVAEIIVRKQHIGSYSNDLGFKLQPDGSYAVIRSEYDQMGNFSNVKLHKLEALYALKSIQNTVAEQRQSCEVEPEVNNIIKVKIYL